VLSALDYIIHAFCNACSHLLTAGGVENALCLYVKNKKKVFCTVVLFCYNIVGIKTTNKIFLQHCEFTVFI
jgi:hypothetical protein